MVDVDQSDPASRGAVRLHGLRGRHTTSRHWEWIFSACYRIGARILNTLCGLRHRLVSTTMASQSKSGATAQKIVSHMIIGGSARVEDHDRLAQLGVPGEGRRSPVLARPAHIRSVWMVRVRAGRP